MRILALGDVVGRPGRQVIHDRLPELVREQRIDLVIANAENIAGGSGITPNLFHKLRSYGVDVCTLGDHAFRKSEIGPTLSTSERIVRPANMPASSPGRTYTVITTNNNIQVAVFGLMGRIFMNLPCDDPFAAADKVLTQLPSSVKVRVCDVHAEATSEKVALGHYLDGRASFVFGTHTHVPTADARVLGGGTGYISDIGMCGPYDSVLGRRKDRVLQYMTSAQPAPFDVATGDVRMCGAIAEIDTVTGRAVSIERVEVQGANVEQAYDADDRGAGNHHSGG
ncbi:MAG: TIGR00282 family metallophosphoesterase [Burkholderiales bacterium]|nr:TIGR00282 family metallophosphoesterase [Phycisphaerae bacterium]